MERGVGLPFVTVIIHYYHPMQHAIISQSPPLSLDGSDVPDNENIIRVSRHHLYSTARTTASRISDKSGRREGRSRASLHHPNLQDHYHQAMAETIRSLRVPISHCPPAIPQHSGGPTVRSLIRKAVHRFVALTNVHEEGNHAGVVKNNIFSSSCEKPKVGRVFLHDSRFPDSLVSELFAHDLLHHVMDIEREQLHIELFSPSCLPVPIRFLSSNFSADGLAAAIPLTSTAFSSYSSSSCRDSPAALPYPNPPPPPPPTYSLISGMTGSNDKNEEEAPAAAFRDAMVSDRCLSSFSPLGPPVCSPAPAPRCSTSLSLSFQEDPSMCLSCSSSFSSPSPLEYSNANTFFPAGNQDTENVALPLVKESTVFKLGDAEKAHEREKQEGDNKGKREEEKQNYFDEEVEKEQPQIEEKLVVDEQGQNLPPLPFSPSLSILAKDDTHNQEHDEEVKGDLLPNPVGTHSSEAQESIGINLEKNNKKEAQREEEENLFRRLNDGCTPVHHGAGNSKDTEIFSEEIRKGLRDDLGLSPSLPPILYSASSTTSASPPGLSVTPSSEVVRRYAAADSSSSSCYYCDGVDASPSLIRPPANIPFSLGSSCTLPPPSPPTSRTAAAGTTIEGVNTLHLSKEGIGDYLNNNNNNNNISGDEEDGYESARCAPFLSSINREEFLSYHFHKVHEALLSNDEDSMKETDKKEREEHKEEAEGRERSKEKEEKPVEEVMEGGNSGDRPSPLPHSLFRPSPLLHAKHRLEKKQKRDDEESAKQQQKEEGTEKENAFSTATSTAAVERSVAFFTSSLRVGDGSPPCSFIQETELEFPSGQPTEQQQEKEEEKERERVKEGEEMNKQTKGCAPSCLDEYLSTTPSHITGREVLNFFQNQMKDKEEHEVQHTIITMTEEKKEEAEKEEKKANRGNVDATSLSPSRPPFPLSLHPSEAHIKVEVSIFDSIGEEHKNIGAQELVAFNSPTERTENKSEKYEVGMSGDTNRKRRRENSEAEDEEEESSNDEEEEKEEEDGNGSSSHPKTERIKLEMEEKEKKEERIKYVVIVDEDSSSAEEKGKGKALGFSRSLGWGAQAKAYFDPLTYCDDPAKVKLPREMLGKGIKTRHHF